MVFPMPSFTMFCSAVVPSSVAQAFLAYASRFHQGYSMLDRQLPEK
jgi:hypothetical protein